MIRKGESDGGDLYLIRNDQNQILILSSNEKSLYVGEFTEIQPGKATLKILASQIDKLISLYLQYREEEDAHTEESIAWMSIHNLWHLRNVGAREVGL